MYDKVCIMSSIVFFLKGCNLRCIVALMNPILAYCLENGKDFKKH